MFVVTIIYALNEHQQSLSILHKKYGESINWWSMYSHLYLYIYLSTAIIIRHNKVTIFYLSMLLFFILPESNSDLFKTSDWPLFYQNQGLNIVDVFIQILLLENTFPKCICNWYPPHLEKEYMFLYMFLGSFIYLVIWRIVPSPSRVC